MISEMMMKKKDWIFLYISFDKNKSFSSLSCLSCRTAILPILFFCLSCFSVQADQKQDQLIKRFETYVEDQRQVWKVPGVAIGIIKDDDVLLLRGFGQRGLNDKEPVNEETIFQIGSLTKAFTSALVAIAEDKGWLKWDDKVISFLPDFQMYDPWVTREFEIVDLLSQRSGLPTEAGDTQSFLGATPADMIHNIRFIKPETSFRSTFAYQNIFFVVAGEILKLKTGLPLSEILNNELLTPLGMKETTFSLEHYLNASNKAEWQVRKPGGEIVTLNQSYPERNWNYVLGAAGGINSNVKDMVKWLKLQVNKGAVNGKQLISAKNVKQMHRPYIYAKDLANLDTFYALGWLSSQYSPNPIIWHNGATLGVYDVAAIIPEEKLGIIVLSNVRDSLLAQALVFQFFDFYFGKEGTDWSKTLLTFLEDQELKEKKAQTQPQPFPPMPLENYVGTYHNPIYGTIKVEQGEGQTLVIPIGTQGTKWTLTPWQRDVFTLTWPQVNETETKVFFYSDGNLPVTKMDIEIISKEGSGIFERQF
jgi:CubicO group peptidase (beta-lactamase class C family)